MTFEAFSVGLALALVFGGFGWWLRSASHKFDLIKNQDIPPDVEGVARLAGSAIAGTCPNTTRELIMMFCVLWKQFWLNRQEAGTSEPLGALLAIFAQVNIFEPIQADPTLGEEIPVGQLLVCAYAGVLASGTHSPKELSEALQYIRNRAVGQENSAKRN